MGVPKKRLTKRKKGQRRSHHAMLATKLGNCANCGVANLPHQICHNCGAHRGKLPEEVVDDKKAPKKAKEEKK